jgi:SNF2 family DNA or RNA helicase
LLDFQVAAVKIAAHHVNKRGGVLIGDVVGLGKTLMATAVARILEDDFGLETLIICPKNLVNMWQDYVHKYHLRAKVMSIGLALNDLSKERRYRVVIIDESQNLRNREGKRYRAIQEYIKTNESKCILLSATPYNKTYLDLSSQLRLFVPEDTDLGIRPERLLSEMGELEFIRQHQAMIRSLAAFEYSEYTDDWRELMRLYLIRRTRSFIKANYAFTDQTDGRKYLLFEDGKRHYFPDRVPKRVSFELDENDSKDQYARLYSDTVVDVINHLSLPRYGLGNYISTKASQSVSAEEKRQLDNLSRAGKRLMGFCRTNLFKRLESSGQAFLLSVDRHALRNYVYIYALENGLPLPIGIQSAELLDVSTNDEDTETAEAVQAEMDYAEDNQDQGEETINELGHPFTPTWYATQGKRIYEMYRGPLKKRFKWINSGLFESFLKDALLNDANALRKIMNSLGNWQSANDSKLSALYDIIAKKHPDEKVLVFTQFADTVRYLTKELRGRGVKKFAGVTGHSDDPTAMAWRFSPVSNEKPQAENELRVLIATDVLSEGQNLQDGAIVVNYDLPWALVRLIQRVGRVDRIGQNASKILCYSFLPAAGLERIIRLRARVKQRLQENGEVVGSDELFFEDDLSSQTLKDIYTEKSGILEGETDAEVDLASYAYQIWHNATQDNPQLAKTISELPDVVYSTRELNKEKEQEGVLVYMKTAEGNDSLVWMNKRGESVTQSQLAVLKAAECEPDTPALPHHPKHHELVRAGIQQIVQEEKKTGGQLGRPSGARYRVYERLKRYYDEVKKHQPLFASDELEKAIDDVYRFPLRSAATDILNRQMKVGVSDEDLANLVIELRNDNRLSLREDEIEHREPHIICSLGLFKKGEE